MGEKKTAIVQHKLSYGETLTGLSKSNLLFLILQGGGVYTDAEIEELVVTEDLLLLIPGNSRYSFVPNTVSTVLVLEFDGPIKLSVSEDLEELCAQVPSKEERTIRERGVLNLTEELRYQLKLWNLYFEKGITCPLYWENAIGSFFVLLYNLCDKDELRNFLSSVLTLDYSFSSRVYENIGSCRTVIELAKSLNYSVSGFEKRFKRIFGMPCYKWIRIHRAQEIQFEISNQSLSIKEISEKYNFSSVGAFTRFCKDMYGKTPAVFRKDLYLKRTASVDSVEKNQTFENAINDKAKGDSKISE